MTQTRPAVGPPDHRASMIDTVTATMTALSDPSLVGVGVHDQMAQRLRQALQRPLSVRPTLADVRAAPAVRTACAHLAAEQFEDAFIALQCARDQYPVDVAMR